MVNKTNKSSENENSSDSDRKMTNNAFSQVLTSSNQQPVLKSGTLHYVTSVQYTRSHVQKIIIQLLRQ